MNELLLLLEDSGKYFYRAAKLPLKEEFLTEIQLVISEVTRIKGNSW